VVVLEDAPPAPLPASPSAAAASARRGCLGTLLRPSKRRLRLATTVLAMLLCALCVRVSSRENGCRVVGLGHDVSIEAIAQ